MGLRREETNNMKIGFIGLGRMGSNMVLNLLDNKHEVVVHNRSPEPIREMEKEGAVAAYSIEDLIENLDSQKIIWLMVTAGKPVDEMINKLIPHLSKGDLIIDGGNSYFEDSIIRAKLLAKKGINFLDCGTSGGIEGARNGACIMVGGEKSSFLKIELLLKDICVENGYAHVGTFGAGHFTKMTHNGIEYGMMSALGEGFENLDKHSKKLNLNLQEISKVYSHGSIIEGKLTSLVSKILKRQDFATTKGSVPKGETEEEMQKLESLSQMPILHQARLTRINSRKKPSFAGKIIALLRNEFGGHKLGK